MNDIDEGQRTVKSLWPDLLAHWRKAIRWRLGSPPRAGTNIIAAFQGAPKLYDLG